VLDEAQTIKNPDAQVARAARRLQAEHRLALTGTPVENRLEELWSLFAFTLPGFLGQREGFSARVADALGGPDQRQALAWLRRRVRPFVLRRLKREVAPELPPRTEMVLTCELSDDERGLYEVLRQAALRDVGVALGAGRTLSVLEALLRLRQAACHPGLLPGRAETRSSKLDLLVERLATLAEEGHRALVFSQWTSFLDLCEPALAEAGISACRLDGSTRDRQAVVERFQAEDGPTVFLLSLKAGGTGLNLTAADYVFHLDPWWNPAVEDQAVDRAHRIGQDKPVFSVRLVAAGTVEERIVALQHAKRELASAAIGDEGLLAANLTSVELLALFE
jgi:SNF2 family DNA or RNA helicase